MIEKYKYEIKRKDKIEVEAEIDYSKLQIDYKKLGDVIAQAILDADKIAKQKSNERYENAKLSSASKVIQAICAIFAVVAFLMSLYFFVLGVFNVIPFNIVQVMSLVLLGSLLVIIVVSINIIEKSDSVDLKLTMFSLIIAIATFVVTVLNTNFGG